MAGLAGNRSKGTGIATGWTNRAPGELSRESLRGEEQQNCERSLKKQSSLAQADGYNETRVAVPWKNNVKWLFPQEKVTSHLPCKGTFTLDSL
jgi:hypothetical protein